MEDKYLKPYITEKTSSLINLNKFVFLGSTKFNKISVMQFLSSKYDVDIKSVSTLLKQKKIVRRGRTTGSTKLFKKFIVSLKSDKNIDKLKDLF
jgi:large subunit ribosomal protein L23